MTDAVRAERDSQRSGPNDRARSAARTVSLALGAMVVLDGAVLMLLAVLTAAPMAQRLVEIGFGAVVLAAGVMIAKMGGRRSRPVELSALPGELVLAGSLFYLGVAMGVFQAGGVRYAAGVSQFSAVLVGLTLGSAALALSGAPAPAKQAGAADLATALRNGVLLIVGTILLAIGLGQLALDRLTPPKWNWISFLAITVPGMLILIARELVTQAQASLPPDGRRRLGGQLLTGVMLVGGLWVMIFGSGANLTLGRNGYTVDIKGNGAGLALLLVAAVLLTVVRDLLTPASPALAQGPAAARRAAARNTIYVVGVVAFIFGARAVVMGKDPALVVGGALPAAAVILLAGVLVLVVGRTVAQSARGAVVPDVRSAD